MLEDGSWRVFHSDEHSAQEYLDMGAVDVFSFGPYLIRDGEINPFIAEMTNGKRLSLVVQSVWLNRDIITRFWQKAAFEISALAYRLRKWLN